ncbi:hypothetical protein BJF82_04675 [Kytococcus sp. CUA-901]|nr:hypothetical protein BJF82_04675 [Kytococcus sp. CUA-901]
MRAMAVRKSTALRPSDSLRAITCWWVTCGSPITRMTVSMSSAVCWRSAVSSAPGEEFCEGVVMVAA